MKTTTAPKPKKTGKLNGLHGFFQIRATRIGEPFAPMVFDNPKCVFDYWRGVVSEREWFDPEKEMLVVVSLSRRCQIIAWHLVSIGTESETYATVSGVFRPAVLAGAAKIVMIHNHPSGQAYISSTDFKLTEAMVRAGKLLQVEVLDHVIVTAKEHCSVRAYDPAIFDYYPNVSGCRKK